MKLNGGVYNIKTKYNQDGLWYNELKTHAENEHSRLGNGKTTN